MPWYYQGIVIVIVTHYTEEDKSTTHICFNSLSFAVRPTSVWTTSEFN